MRALRKRRGGARGYTAVEVIISLGILGIGAAGVISMQRGAVRALDDARQLDIASQIAREWLERLRRDAALWTNNNIAQAPLLAACSGANCIGTGNWEFPTALLSGAPTPEGRSPVFDIFGRDLALDTDPQYFCTQIRLNWLVTNQMLRADVRVFWLKKQMRVAPPAMPASQFCNTTAFAASSGPDASNSDEIYRFVYATSAVRQNVAPQ